MNPSNVGVRSFVVFSALCAASWLAACGSSDATCEETRTCGSGGNAGSGGDAATGDFSISVDPGPHGVTQGASASFTVTLTRTGDSTEPVFVFVEAPQDNPKFSAVLMAGDESSAPIGVSTFDDTEQGAHTVTVTALGTQSGISKQAETAVVVRGRPGSLDTTFGTHGIATTNIAGTGASANGVLVTEDDSIVVVGTASDTAGTDSGVALAKYAPDGVLSSSFGSNGVLNDPKVETEQSIAAVDQGTSGIVVLSDMIPNKPKLRRYLADGTIDAGFGFAGVAQMPASATGFAARALVRQASGRLVVVGTVVGASGASNIAAVGFTQDGEIDASFGNAGLAATSSAACEQVNDALVLPGEGIFLVGESYDCADTSTMQPLTVKLGASGQADLGYGTGGKSVVGLGGPALAAIPGPPEAFLVLSGELFVRVVALASDGQDSGSLGSTGTLLLAGAWHDLLRDAEDRIVVAGSFIDTISFARLGPDATPDPSFGENGYATTVFPAQLGGKTHRALQKDGRIVVVGTDTTPSASSVAQRIFVARFWN